MVILLAENHSNIVYSVNTSIQENRKGYFSKLNQMKFSRFEFKSIAVNKFIYSIGIQNHTQVESYDINENEWKIRRELNQSRMKSLIFYYRDHIYNIFGEARNKFNYDYEFLETKKVNGLPEDIFNSNFLEFGLLLIRIILI